eukprot:COSAG06_NODE_32277_length_508_cov_11.051345_1_plen_60_part_10
MPACATGTQTERSTVRSIARARSYVARCLARCGYTIIVPARPRFEDDAAGAAEAITRETP